MKINLTFSETFDIWYSNYANNKQGKDLLRAEGIHPDQLDVGNMSHKYFTQETCDMSVDANANSNEEHSYNNYYAEITKGLHKIEGYYLLFRYAEKRFGTDYAMDLMDSIVQGDLYFHDPTKIQVPYCYAYSTQFIMLYGRPYGQLYSVPPKRSDSFMAEVTETTMDLSQEFAGAIAMGDIIVNLCYYLKKEGYGVLEDGAYRFNLAEQSYVKNLFQKFIHVMNNKFRLSGESPFTNISIFDRGKLGTLFDGYHYPDGSTVDYDYVLAVQELFMDLFHLGDPTTGLPYRFPVVTINFDVEKDEEGNLVPVDKEFAMKAAHYNRPKGAFNIYPTSGTKVASCCRLSNDFDRMKARQDSFGNGGLNIGSHRVVTVNLPRVALDTQEIIAYDFSNAEEKFFTILEKRLDQAKDLLLVHREEILRRRIEKGFLKFFDPNQVGWFNLEGMFSTFGITGVYEMCKYLGYEITSKEGEEFVSKVLTFIEDYADKVSKETGHSFNVEEIPAENTGTKLAYKDNLLYGTDCKLYSNQFVPLMADVPVMDRLELEGKFMSKLSGGAITHINVLSEIDTDEKMYKLMLAAMSKGVEHFACNYGFNECEDGHVSIGGNQLDYCPICNKPIKDHITRVVGFFTRVSKWSAVRKEEFTKRTFKNV